MRVKLLLVLLPVLLVSSPRGSRFFTQSVSLDAALQALVGVVLEASLSHIEHNFGTAMT